MRFCLLFALAAAGAAAATTLVHWDVTELSRRSATVVQGRVTRVSARWSSDGLKILTDIDVQVDSVWKGWAGERVHIVQMGGTMEGVAQRVDGIAAFGTGEEVVVFLEPEAEDTFRLVGMGQGKFRVDRSRGARAIPELLQSTDLIDEKTHQKVKASSTPVPLEVLRAQVQAAFEGHP